MAFSKHYNWYQFIRVLDESFNLNVVWSRIDSMFSIKYNEQKIIIKKTNKMSDIYVEQILKKLNITLKQFEQEFDTVFRT